MAASARPINSSALWAGGREPPRRPRRRRPVDEPAGSGPPAGPVASVATIEATPLSWRGRIRRRYGWRLAAMPFLAALTVLTIVLIARTPQPADQAAVQVAGASSVAFADVGAATSAAPSGASSTAARTDTGNGQTAGAAAGQPVTSVPAASDTDAPTPSAASGTAASGTAAAEGSSSVPTDPTEILPANLAVGALPAGDAFTVAGEGTYRIVGGVGPQAGTAPTVLTYTIEIENGVTPAEGDEAFARFVDQTLADQRSWITVKGVSLQRVDAPDATPNFRITLASQQTVRGMCGYSVHLESSCYTGAEGRVVINDSRWVRGSLTYGTDLTAYREYAINHEVGHALGYGHQPCGENGALAPVMMQQSWSASNDALAGINGSVSADGKACQPNPWPDPAGAEGQATGPTG